MIKILASDLDGTLIKNEVVSDKDIQAIKKLKDLGHKMIISTGRSPSGVKHLTDKTPIEYDYLVLCNGALVLDRDHEIIIKKEIPSSVIKDLHQTILKNEEYIFYVDDGKHSMLLEGCVTEPYVDSGYFTKRISHQGVLERSHEYVLLSLLSKDGTVEAAEKIKNYVLDKHGDKVEAFRNQIFVDIVPKGCSKGEGINSVLAKIEEEIVGVYTIGDSWNDVSMFEITENSYTFHEVEEELKNYAKNRVNYVHECIEEMLKN